MILQEINGFDVKMIAVFICVGYSSFFTNIQLLGTDRMKQIAQKPNYGFSQQELELAQGELKVALALANYSSAAYSRGNLKHALDARSKAQSLCMRATARLTADSR